MTEGGGEFPEEFAVEKMPEGGRKGRATGPIYLHSEDSIRQLTKALDRIYLEGGNGNVIITGDEGVGTLGLARELVRRYRQINPNFVGRSQSPKEDILQGRICCVSSPGCHSGR